jgi:hypothetical protein
MIGVPTRSCAVEALLKSGSTLLSNTGGDIPLLKDNASEQESFCLPDADSVDA